MIPVVIEDVVEGLATAQNIYKIAFRNASNENPSYKEFGEDIRKLAVNLDLLFNVLQRAEYQAGTSDKSRYNSAPGLEAQLVGNFKGTLKECEYLLNDQRYFQRSGGLIQTLSLYAQIDPEVQLLRERIKCHNLKLSIIFNILDPQVLEDRFFHIVDSTALILGHAEQIGRRAHEEEEGKPLPRPGTAYVSIPRELEDGFIRTTRQTDPDLFTLRQGLDAAISYFNRTTKTASQEVLSDVAYHVAIIDIMMAAWLIRTIRGSKEYQVVASYPSVDVSQRLLDSWGMTTERFFDFCEQALQDALRRILGRHLILPPTPDLLSIFERQRPTGQQTQQSLSLDQAKNLQQRTRDPVELADTSISNWEVEQMQRGVKEMSAHLTACSRSKVLEDFRPRLYADLATLQTDGDPLKPGFGKDFSVGRKGERNNVGASLVSCSSKLTACRDNYDLGQVQLNPSYALRTWTAPSLEPQTINFRTDQNSPFSRTLVFHQNKDMFDFQQKMTGYRVVHDEPRVLATSQESKLLGGSNRQDLGRLQLWSAPPPSKDDSKVPPSETSLSSRKRMSQASSSSNSSSKKKSTPSIFSRTSRSSSASRSTIVTHPPSYVTTSSSQNPVLFPPIAPCVVLFAHKAPTISARVEGRDISRSFLVIEIGSDVTVEEELSEEALEPSSHRCVIERKSTYLQARRSPETTDPGLWDLAAVGIQQRERETDVVKKLKHVVLQFNTHDNLRQFITKFNQVKGVATTWHMELQSDSRSRLLSILSPSLVIYEPKLESQVSTGKDSLRKGAQIA
ncbi:uncharacterized protein PAC_11760 [Phialocephala subalpina]|uniref:Uncharacterized protein n=1 Tax=Phialocephala subalpina TaxID=576137 RepID=A0A1L7XA04_9HELO|nr:uncharacterized protein PAC_11760 [Phialocephala subalpina]